MNPRKVYEKILSGSRNIRFEDLCRLAVAFGFRHDRTSGSHRIFRHPAGLMVNFQPDRNGRPNSIKCDNCLNWWKKTA